VVSEGPGAAVLLPAGPEGAGVAEPVTEVSWPLLALGEALGAAVGGAEGLKVVVEKLHRRMTSSTAASVSANLSACKY
jgi:hypothetical protein